MEREAVLRAYEVVNQLAKGFADEAWAIHREVGVNAYDDVVMDDDLVQAVTDAATILRYQLIGNAKTTIAPERLASAVLGLELDADQRRQVADVIEALVGEERRSCAALVEQLAARWGETHPDDQVPVSAFLKDLKSLSEMVRARGGHQA